MSLAKSHPYHLGRYTYLRDWHISQDTKANMSTLCQKRPPILQHPSIHGCEVGHNKPQPGSGGRSWPLIGGTKNPQYVKFVRYYNGQGGGTLTPCVPRYGHSTKGYSIPQGIFWPSYKIGRHNITTSFHPKYVEQRKFMFPFWALSIEESLNLFATFTPATAGVLPLCHFLCWSRLKKILYSSYKRGSGGTTKVNVWQT